MNFRFFFYRKDFMFLFTSENDTFPRKINPIAKYVRL